MQLKTLNQNSFTERIKISFLVFEIIGFKVLKRAALTSEYFGPKVVLNKLYNR
jgi:hypothetical protein